MAEKLQVGQKLWYVPADGRDAHRSRYVTVTSIGRKWADLDINSRVNLETLWMEARRGYPSNGQCYVSKEAYEEEVGRQRLWRSIRDAIGWSAPSGITTDAIRQAAALLGIQLPDTKEDANG